MNGSPIETTEEALAGTQPEEDEGYLIQAPETLTDPQFEALVDGATARSNPKPEYVPTLQQARKLVLQNLDALLRQQGVSRAQRRVLLYRKPRQYDISGMARLLIQTIRERIESNV